MSLPKYPAYKDSGVSWLGEVPAHWEVKPLKYLASFSGGGTPSRDSLEYWNGEIPWVSPKDMKQEKVTDAEERITELGVLESSTSLQKPGQALLVVRSGILKHTIPVAINEVFVALNQDMKALDFGDHFLSRFFLRWVQGHNDQLLNAWLKQGATVESIEHQYLAETKLPLPPQDEVVEITEFLDRETAKIDALIAEQEKLIALLAEKRQATISRAVTRGLDPNVPLKDSGVPWLGKVPAHWDCRKLSTVADAIGDGLHGTPNYSEDSECFFINGNNLSSGRIRITESTRMVCMQDYLLQNILLDHRSVLLSINGTIGNVALYAGEKVMLGKSAAYINCGESVSREYLAYFLLSDIFRNYFLSNLSGTTIYNLSLETIRLAKIPLPNIDDQLNIVAYLDQKLYQLDELVAEATSSIGLLKERRAALISAAVTGKIDVRGLAA